MKLRRVRRIPPPGEGGSRAGLLVTVHALRDGQAVRLATFELTPADIATLPAAGRGLLSRLLERQACVDGEH